MTKRDATESKSRGLKYTDLPLLLRQQTNGVLEFRKGLGLRDDSVDRKERAVRYQERS